MKEIEELQIYQKYLDLMYYVNMITKKYPKAERFALVTELKRVTYDGMECILYCYKSYDRIEKLKYLNELDVKLKMMKVLARLSYKNQYINARNYDAWCRKMLDISNMMGKMEIVDIHLRLWLILFNS